VYEIVNQPLSQHLQRYPRMGLADIYKLLHQAALGPGHAVEDSVAASARLEAEMTGLGEGPEDLIADPISPDGKLARIHLRPYLAAGYGADVLANAFVQTANTFPSAPDKLVKFCGCLGDLAEAGGLPFPREEVERYFQSIASQGYPVVHHSEGYREAYRPAYRVVALDLLPALHRI
jgi:hypothetical protein